MNGSLEHTEEPDILKRDLQDRKRKEADEKWFYGNFKGSFSHRRVRRAWHRDPPAPLAYIWCIEARSTAGSAPRARETDEITSKTLSSLWPLLHFKQVCSLLPAAILY